MNTLQQLSFIILLFTFFNAESQHSKTEMKSIEIAYNQIDSEKELHPYEGVQKVDELIINKKKEVVQEKPNFIFFIADDMYPDMFNTRPEGKGENLTPNIDRLANEGVFMTGQMVSSPVCTPSRYNSLTGTYASRATNIEFTDFTKENEGQTVIQWNSFITPGKEKTIGNYLQELGYKTGFVGKNHAIESLEQVDQSKKPDLYADPTDPKVIAELEYRHKMLQEDIKNCGFDFADNLYHDNPNWLGIKALASQNMDWITEGGLRFIDNYKDSPFFLYFATTIPHHPLNAENSYDADPRITSKGLLEEPLNVQPSRESLKIRIKESGLSGEKKTNLLWMDDALGALINKLEETGKLDNTIIVFFNDHGQNSKGTLYEGGIHSQTIIWKKGGFKVGNTSDVKVSNIDFLPTILDFAGVKETSTIGDGYSFKAALDGEEFIPRSSNFYELGYARAVVKGKYKYIAIRYPEYATKLNAEERAKILKEYNEFRESFGGEAISYDSTLPYGHLEMVPGGGGAEHATYGNKSGFFDVDQLYDLEADPIEENNLALKEAYKAVLEEMKIEMQEHLDKLPGKFEI
ncbi:Arylsulfatase A [Lutibacter agarilyticus]|uniref:Arylsulfatase A n=1 Tax=Lutibacter agarilyticus TaxID=1109740 RepID=A0A238Z5W3_9FLAO|nr:sulfatase-like hydrolase/transferase [Lutibacter agarilyticus]SNR78311.1 Arylsulfatase A [Lutibacter agarilyticus]